MTTGGKRARVAHQMPGRIRIKLPLEIGRNEAKELLRDLKLSPDVRSATLRGSSLIIEHNRSEQALTALGAYLNNIFPEFGLWSDTVDAQIAKAAADPWINKSLPLAFVGLAVHTWLSEGAILAGESAFALAYVAFDLYWKFQQENVIRKIESGLSTKQRADIEEKGKAQ